jgi:quinol monooxygenase YgiN
MTEPIVVTAIFVPAPGQFDAVHAALLPAIAAVHEEPGCLLYAIHRAPNDSIVMIEKWDSAELNASLEGKLASPVEVTRLEPLAAGTDLQGTL